MKQVRMVYLAGPIDMAAPDAAYDCKQFRAEAKQRLMDCNISSFDPSAAFYWSLFREDGILMVSINKAALQLCDAMLAYLPQGVETIGTARELEICKQWGKRIVVVRPNVGPLPSYLLDCEVFPELTPAVHHLAKLND